MERKDAWEVARLLRSICDAYSESTGRAEATVYVSGTGTPSSEIEVCAEWEQETIDANRMPNVPDSVKSDNGVMFPLLKSYEIEFHEIATNEKILERSG
ncbi:MAG: hypothetical protein CL698_07325 [Chloroflexi bacterium]|nr:hypothetical protein [Chloroflexota bacterium]MQG01144.1 hypothetical protein [SAR202 cluster bacterium]